MMDFNTLRLKSLELRQE